jgi:cysteine sulfinate desulfinase/cysteine desulfurase-like protein
VLKALGLPDDAVRASVRIGLGRGNTAEEVELVADRIVEAVRALRAAREVRGREAPAGRSA